MSGRFRAGSLVEPGLLAIVSLGAILAVSGPSSGPIAAVFPPWWDAGRTLQAAAVAGPVTRFGAFPFVAVIAPDGPGARERLRSAGAWLILNPVVLGGCDARATT